MGLAFLALFSADQSVSFPHLADQLLLGKILEIFSFFGALEQNIILNNSKVYLVSFDSEISVQRLAFPSPTAKADTANSKAFQYRIHRTLPMNSLVFRLMLNQRLLQLTLPLMERSASRAEIFLYT
jgi:hypothetical protein